MKIAILIAVATLFLGICPPVLAQRSGAAPPAPIPPLFSGDSNSTENQETQQPTMQPDSSPLSGVLKWTIGSGESVPNVLLPSLRFSESGDTNATNSSATSGQLQAITVLSGSLALQRISTAHQLSLDYTGGGTFYSVSNSLNSTFHSLRLIEVYSFRRWSLTLVDILSYANQIGVGVGWLPVYLITPTGPVYFFTESTILTQPTPRITNTTLGQVEYRFSPRVSVTAGGLYGLLHFLNGDFFNNNQLGGYTGFNYTPNGKDSFALTYNYSDYRYENFSYSLKSHSVQLRYGRRLTGRYAVQFGAGPQIFKQTPAPTHLGCNATALVTAKMGRTDASLGYYHTITPGSGVLPGAHTDVVQLGLSRALWRVWNASTQAGYARNSAPYGFSGTYSYVSAGVSMSRKIGRQASGSSFFNVQHQGYGEGGCSANGCGVARYTFGVGMQWNFHPIRLE